MSGKMKIANKVVDFLAAVICPGFGLFLQKRWNEAAAFFFASIIAFLVLIPIAYVIWLCSIYYTVRTREGGRKVRLP